MNSWARGRGRQRLTVDESARREVAEPPQRGLVTQGGRSEMPRRPPPSMDDWLRGSGRSGVIWDRVTVES